MGWEHLSNNWPYLATGISLILTVWIYLHKYVHSELERKWKRVYDVLSEQLWYKINELSLEIGDLLRKISKDSDGLNITDEELEAVLKEFRKFDSMLRELTQELYQYVDFNEFLKLDKGYLFMVRSLNKGFKIIISFFIICIISIAFINNIESVMTITAYLVIFAGIMAYAPLRTFYTIYSAINDLYLKIDSDRIISLDDEVVSKLMNITKVRRAR